MHALKLRHYIAGIALASGIAHAWAADEAKPAASEATATAAADSKHQHEADSATAPAAAESQAATAAPAKKPRHPDTAGWRRIMAGSGRT